MKTILVATDFSAAAQNATNYAADMASTIDGDVLLLHVYHVPVSYGEIPAVVTPDDLMQDAERNINELKERLIRKTNGKLSIVTEVRMGSFFEELATVCERIKPYTVVMGSQGTTAAERLFFGSHTVYALKHLVWPLITVPPQSKFSTVKKIGLACDFNKVEDNTPVDEIRTLVNDFHAALHVLNTGKKEAFNPELVFESGLLQEMLKDLKPEYHFITNENTDEGIMDFAEKNNIDLLVVLPKRHGLLEKLLLKSHSKQLVLHSHVPVMALH
jgi:nucleotide-binding universal stress UspA family protein